MQHIICEIPDKFEKPALIESLTSSSAFSTITTLEKIGSCEFFPAKEWLFENNDTRLAADKNDLLLLIASVLVAAGTRELCGLSPNAYFSFEI